MFVPNNQITLQKLNPSVIRLFRMSSVAFWAHPQNTFCFSAQKRLVLKEAHKIMKTGPVKFVCVTYYAGICYCFIINRSLFA